METDNGMDNSGRKFSFGLYEAEPASGELRKNGTKLRIQEQPFQILLELLRRPGEVVTRDELRDKLWPADTFVDFDHGLNTAINKLREVLGDKASNPRFVETLARRGYRFIAPVKVIGGPELLAPAKAVEAPPVAGAPAMEAPVTIAVATHAAEPSIFSGEDLPQPSRWLSRALFALAQIMYLIFYAVALVNLDQLPILVANFLGGIVVNVVIPVVLVTATVGIAFRLYLLTAVLFDFRPLGEKFKKLYPFILPLDQLWALAPFLLVSRIGIGAAFAACAGLLYLPFSERTLIKMAYRWPA
jgi:DNA-binding winged helix-turn-helix (wHTH) protein